jgi:hypothetical protein
LFGWLLGSSIAPVPVVPARAAGPPIMPGPPASIAPAPPLVMAPAPPVV